MDYPIKGGNDRYQVYINGAQRESEGIEAHVSVTPTRENIVLETPG